MADKILCDECNIEADEAHRYCHNCGAYLWPEATTINIFNNGDLRKILSFYFVYLVICLVVKHTDWFTSYDELFWIEILLATVTIFFASYNWKAISEIINLKNCRWKVLSGVIVISVLASLIINVGVRELNGTFFKTNINYFRPYQYYHYPMLVMVYSIALMPALFEELAFRGVMYNYCARFLDEKLVVVVTAFLFAIMHLNMVALLWLIPFGYFMGYLRRRYNTLWYGIVFHFMFNFIACVLDLQRQGMLF